MSMSSKNTAEVSHSTDQSYFGNLGKNIIEKCSCLTKAVREYYQLPVSDQEQVWNDLTGLEAKRRIFVEGKELVGFSEEYEPKILVDKSLRRLEEEIQRRVSKNDAFQKAREKNSDYVDARSFRLKFLRAEKFDVVNAAIRITRHFEEKLELFGEDKLGRDILLSDLSDDDVDSLQRGYFQVLPELDHSNRKVLFYYKAVCDCYKQRENLLRSFWYVSNSISNDEQVQKLGVANIVYNLGGFPKNGMDYEKSRRLARLIRAIPVRFNVFYVCLDEGSWFTVVETFSVMISRFLRLRLRMMQGSHSQIKQKVDAVGLPSDALPVNDRSELIVDSWRDWINLQREAEKVENADPPPLLFDYNDILGIQTSSGSSNDIFTALLESTADIYGYPSKTKAHHIAKVSRADGEDCSAKHNSTEAACTGGTSTLESSAENDEVNESIRKSKSKKYKVIG